MEFKHSPVMLRECIEALNIKEDGTYIDCTLGGGGHFTEIAKWLSEDGRLIGIDKDADAIEAYKKRNMKTRCEIDIVKSDFKDIKEVARELKLEGVDGILMDLGVSSYQLDEASRGFSYKNDAPLDMRMDREQKFTAETVVNDYSKEELARIIREYSDERWAGRIATAIVKERETSRIESTVRLSEIVKGAIPAAARRTGPHPAKRTFQAIRIEVNGELKMLEKALKDAKSILNKNGRLAVISFHSLEDRIVKKWIQDELHPCVCPKDIPVCTCNRRSDIIIAGKIVYPPKAEIDSNPRARSAKLRVIERVA